MREKVIARWVCGDCPPKRRHVLAELVDTARGVELAGNLKAPRYRVDYNGMLIAEMATDQWWWGDRAQHHVELRCPDHHRSCAMTVQTIREVEAKYRTSGKIVVVVVDLQRS